MLRACGNETRSNPSPSVTEVKKKGRKQRRRTRRILKHKLPRFIIIDILCSLVMATLDQLNKNMVVFLQVEDVETKEDGGAPVDTKVIMETNASEKSDNIVLRKLLVS
ncbi:hypothetical protein L1987_22821 [Smallanthus sonchifolius]|uniref:Uncharacterized protein n=1 Tax=Smallanthus sonchifolius TaxID=185202 RepID=A0ACB9IF66_9ASTR|nr:hypothetical protein L1987_22821 [Smallanthus sonchifolius]